MKKLEIEIDLKNKSKFVSEYNDNTLDPHLRDYVINELIGYDLNTKVTINIFAKYELVESDKEEYKKIFKKEFRECLYDLKEKRNHSNYKRLALFVIGLLCILLDYYCSAYFGDVISEIITIFGWVALWELIYSILFTAVSRRRDIKRYEQILKAEIKFR